MFLYRGTERNCVHVRMFSTPSTGQTLFMFMSLQGQHVH